MCAARYRGPGAIDLYDLVGAFQVDVDFSEPIDDAEFRREADRDENELASRIQALGADRSRLADELDGSLVKSRRLERANREIAERLDAAIGTIRAVLDAGESS